MKTATKQLDLSMAKLDSSRIPHVFVPGKPDSGKRCRRPSSWMVLAVPAPYEDVSIPIRWSEKCGKASAIVTIPFNNHDWGNMVLNHGHICYKNVRFCCSWVPRLIMDTLPKQAKMLRLHKKKLIDPDFTNTEPIFHGDWIMLNPHVW